MRILVAMEAVDLRKGIDGLAQLCREKLGVDPFSGCLFIFRSRRATAIKVLAFDGQGFWIAQKRLSKGRFVCELSVACARNRADLFLGGIGRQDSANRGAADLKATRDF
jgi:transposase